MSKVNHFDFSQICFDSDSMQVLSLSNRNKNVELPFTKGPVNFSIVGIDGTVSNRWGANVNPKGDAYIYCRDNPNAEKVSLHASGNQHVSIRSEVAKNIGATSRFGNKWTEPDFGIEAIATFTMAFPPWGIGLDLKDIPKLSKKDKLLIIGHSEKLVVVAFYIVDKDKRMQGQVPHIKLGRLPLGRGKALHIIAWKEHQGDLMERVRGLLPQVAQRLSKLDGRGGKYLLSVQGYRQPNSAFMVSVPVSYRNRFS